MHIDNDDVRSYQKRHIYDFEKPKSSNVTPFTIFVAVLAAIIAFWFIHNAYRQWQIEQAAKEFNLRLSILNAQSEKQLREIQIKRELEMQRARDQEIKRAEEVLRAKQEALQKDLYEREQKALSLKQVSDKEAAWKSYYKPVEGCESSNQNRDAIKCGNDYIKSRKQFEASWGKE